MAKKVLPNIDVDVPMLSSPAPKDERHRFRLAKPGTYQRKDGGSITTSAPRMVVTGTSADDLAGPGVEYLGKS